MPKFAVTYIFRDQQIHRPAHTMVLEATTPTEATQRFNACLEPMKIFVRKEIEGIKILRVNEIRAKGGD